MMKKATNLVGFVAAVIGLIGAVQGLDLSSFISRDRTRQDAKPAGITWQQPDLRKAGACEPTCLAHPPQVTKAAVSCH